jgi:hypothetical protein
LRIESPTKTRQSFLKLTADSDERIITLLHNDLASIKAEYPDLGNKCWVNGYIQDAFSTSVINSLEEIPFPQFNPEDTESDTLRKAIDAEWNSPRAHLCFWLNDNAVPTANATTNNPGNWIYKGKLSLLNSYGYPEKYHRWFDFLTDNITRILGEDARIGVSFQWVDRQFYHTLNKVEYTPNPDPNNPLILSRFSETLPALAAGAIYRLDGLRVIDGSSLPIEPITNLTGNVLTVSFTAEDRVGPGKVKALISEVGNKQKLTSVDLVTIDCTWSQEIISFQPDFTPTPIVAQSVTQVTRNREQTLYTVTTTRQSVLNDRTSRVSSRLINRGATNVLFYKLGGDVSVSALIPAGQSGGAGGYHGSIAASGSADLPAGYTGTVSVVTSTGQTQCLAEETFLVSGA